MTQYDNRITLQKLEVLCCVVELGGVSRAAEHLWVAQPVVSGHLRSLQERLGVQVIYREGQQMKLTEAGEQVYRWASETLSGTRRLMRSLEGLDEAANGALALAASMSVGSYLLPPILAEFRRAVPRAIITMSVFDPGHAFAAVGSGECDLGIVIADTEHQHPQVRCDVIGREEIVLVAAPDSLPGISTISLDAVAELPLISSPRGHVQRELVDRQLAERGVAARNIVMELGHPEAMKRVALTGIGACLLFRACVEEELRQGVLREVPIEDADLSLPLLSVSRSHVHPARVQKELVAFIRSRLATAG